MTIDEYTSPVITGHRGWKAKYTENTLYGFVKSYGCGATILETDLWITLDEVIVISHDVNTKRIFCHENGEPADYVITKCTYDEIKDLRTIESGERLLTFQDVLRWFVGYVKNHDSNVHKLMLDIKKNNPAKVMKFIVKDLMAVREDIGWWLHRVQLGVWGLNFLKYLNQDPYFLTVFTPDVKNPFHYTQFDIFHISTNWHDSVFYIAYTDYVRNLTREDGRFRFGLTGVSALYVQTWSVDFLKEFLPLLKSHDMKLYSWTINTTQQYDYLRNIGRIADLKEYGVISDKPDIMVDHKNGLDKASADTFLTTETTGIGSSDKERLIEDYSVIRLSIKQKIYYQIYKFLVTVAATKNVSEKDKDFSAYVDGDAVNGVKINPIVSWVFRTLQHYGVI